MIEDEKCLHCRVNDLEDWLTALSATVAWSLLAAAGYALWKSGVLRLEVFHG